MRRLLQHWLSEQAQRRPEAVALAFKGQRVTYGELDNWTNQLARLLVASGCQTGDRIALLVPKSVHALVGILATLKADCAYVPMDTASPPVRIARMLDVCESRVVLATSATSRLLREALAAAQLQPLPRVGWMETEPPQDPGFELACTWADAATFSTHPPDSGRASHEMAHILFTSGSTGIPKGVVITHANVIQFVEWATDYFGTSSTDRISCHPPLHFDLSTFDIFGTLSAGAALHLVPPELNMLPQKLAQFIRDTELTQWFSAPSILVHLAKFDAVRSGDFPSLKRLLWCGEVFPTPSLIYWMKRLPTGVTFTNLYGPTEATIASSYYRIPHCPQDERAAVSIGQPCAGEDLLVLDEQLNPVAQGSVGELCIRGVGLSPGYWGDPEKTNAVFLQNPHSSDPTERIYKTGDLARIGDDGLLYLVGRADSQVKSRGYRIELGEVEAALNTVSTVRECAVVAVHTDGFEGNEICCAYVPADGAGVSPQELRREVARLLPNYMIPTRWLALERMPRNQNEKVDRRQLKEAFQEELVTAAR